jgi:RNA polymerase sigma-70 factor (ECF subfamily)
VREELQAANAINEPAGLVAVYDQHCGDLLRFLRARTRDPAEAEDVVQELWLRLRDLRPGPISNARAYLYQMANNLVLDRARARRRRGIRDHSWTEQSYALAPGPDGEIQTVDPGQTPEAQLVEAEEQRALESAIAELPEGARRAFCLHKIDGLSHAEVAVRLGISRSGVEKHIAVAMKNLRRLLADCGPGGVAASPSADSRPGTR